ARHAAGTHAPALDELEAARRFGAHGHLEQAAQGRAHTFKWRKRKDGIERIAVATNHQRRGTKRSLARVRTASRIWRAASSAETSHRSLPMPAVMAVSTKPGLIVQTCTLDSARRLRSAS